MQHTITIVISRTDTLIGKIIRSVHKGYYNHCSFYLDDETDKLWSFSRKYDKFFFTGCFCSETSKRYIAYQKFTFMIDDTVYKDICNEIKRLKKHYRIYAYQNAVLINFNKSIDSKNHFICSTFVANIIDKYNLVKLIKPANICLPMDVYKSLSCAKSNMIR